MGYNTTNLVDENVALANAPGEAARMIEWLQSRGIIGTGMRASDLDRQKYGEPLGSSAERDYMIYAVGPNFEAASPEGTTSEDEWFRVYTERNVFVPLEMDIGVYCPRCQEEQSQHGDAWLDAIATWSEGRPETLTCVGCGYAAPLSGWTFDSEWGFGNLGFEFMTWAPDPQFISEFEKELGRPLTVVIAHF